MTEHNDRSPREIEREIEQERSALSDTLEALQDSVSVERLVGTATRQLREHGSDIGGALSRSVKENPLALALTGVGLAWLIMGPREREARGVTPSQQRAMDSYRGRGPRHDSSRHQTGATSEASQTAEFWGGPDRQTASRDTRITGSGMTGGARSSSSGDSSRGGETASTMSQIRDKASGAMHQAGDAAKSWRDSGSETAHDLRERSGEAADWVRQSGSDAAGWMSGTAHDMRSRLMEGTHDLSEEARARVIAARERAIEARARMEDAAMRGQERARAFYDEQPLVVGALAVLLGAAAGAALPRTRIEDEHFGEYGQDLFDEAEQVYREERDRVARVAQAAIEEARRVGGEIAEELKDQIPDGEEVLDAVERKAKDAATRTAEAAEREAKK